MRLALYSGGIARSVLEHALDWMRLNKCAEDEGTNETQLHASRVYSTGSDRPFADEPGRATSSNGQRARFSR